MLRVWLRRLKIAGLVYLAYVALNIPTQLFLNRGIVSAVAYAFGMDNRGETKLMTPMSPASFSFNAFERRIYLISIQASPINGKPLSEIATHFGHMLPSSPPPPELVFRVVVTSSFGRTIFDEPVKSTRINGFSPGQFVARTLAEDIFNWGVTALRLLRTQCLMDLSKFDT